MTAVGFTYMLGALTASDDSVVFTIGVMLSSLYFVVFAHMLLAYPDGRLERPWHAWLLAAGYVLTLVGLAAAAAVGLHRADGRQLPRLPGVGAADRAQRHAARRLQRARSRSSAWRWSPSCSSSSSAAGAPRRRRSGARWPRSCGRAWRCWSWSARRWARDAAGDLAAHRRARVGRPARLRLGALGVPDRPRAQPRGARRRGVRAAAAARRGARAPGRCAAGSPTRSATARSSSSSGSRTRAAGSTPRATWSSCRPTTTRHGRGPRSSSRAAAWARSCTT